MISRTGRWFKFNRETGRFDAASPEDPAAMPEVYMFQSDGASGMRLAEIAVGDPPLRIHCPIGEAILECGKPNAGQPLIL